MSEMSIDHEQCLQKSWEGERGRGKERESEFTTEVWARGRERERE